MTQIPIVLMLKREEQKKLARAQDIIVKELFKIFDNAVLHGGTAIWRCYQGNRFSEDVDVYIPRDLKKLEEFFKTLEKRGFKILKKRIRDNSLYTGLDFNRIETKFEAVFKIIKGELKDYEDVEGNKNTIGCLNAEQLVKEKVSAYLDRKKIRDLYDIFFLLRHIKNKSLIKEDLNKLIANYKKPIDEDNLKSLIIEGLVPKTEDLLDYIKHEA